MPITDIYNIVHDMTLLGQNVLNVYQAERTSGIETAGSISDGFQNSLLPIIRLWQSTILINNELRIFNLGTTTDFGTFTLSAAPGLRMVADTPAFSCGELRFPSLDRAVRAGFKRYAGMGETDDTDGVLTGAAITLLNNIGTVVIAPWLSSIDSHAICNNIIVKRICTVIPVPAGGCPSYRLPVDDTELVFYNPNQFITLSTTRSQVSRRPPA